MGRAQGLHLCRLGASAQRSTQGWLEGTGHLVAWCLDTSWLWYQVIMRLC